MKNRNIRLVIAYDGTDFCGWQRQGAVSSEQGTVNSEQRTASKETQMTQREEKPQRTIQGVTEDALGEMHGHPVCLTGAGRTDAGVHASGQVANFYTDIKSIKATKFVPALNSLLPKEIRVLEADEVPENFHARFSAVSRTYRYHFILCRPALPHEYRYNLQLWRNPQIETLNAYGRLLLGETDCSIFAGAGDSALRAGKSKNRFVYSAYFFIENNRLIFEIRANAFLRNMVRSVAGTFLHYEEKGLAPENLRKIIASGERSLAGPTLPPQGLFLWKVEY